MEFQKHRLFPEEYGTKDGPLILDLSFLDMYKLLGQGVVNFTKANKKLNKNFSLTLVPVLVPNFDSLGLVPKYNKKVPFA